MIPNVTICVKLDDYINENDEYESDGTIDMIHVERKEINNCYVTSLEAATKNETIESIPNLITSNPILSIVQSNLEHRQQNQDLNNESTSTLLQSIEKQTSSSFFNDESDVERRKATELVRGLESDESKSANFQGPMRHHRYDLHPLVSVYNILANSSNRPVPKTLLEYQEKHNRLFDITPLDKT